MIRTSAIMLLSILMFLICACSDGRQEAEKLYRTAKQFERRSKMDSAAIYYEKALARYPAHLRANRDYQKVKSHYFNEGQALREKYRRLAKDHPNDVIYQYFYGNVMEDKQQKLQQAEKVINMDPTFYGGYELLGDANLALGYDLDALDAYRRILEIDSTQTDIFARCARAVSGARFYAYRS